MPLTTATSERYSLLDIQTVLLANQPSPIYLTNSTAPLDVDGAVYLPVPSMEFRLPIYVGATIPRDEAAIIRMADTQALWRDMTSGRAHPRVRVRLREVTFDIDTQTATALITLWTGFVEAVEVNPEGDEGLVEVTVGPCGGRTTNDPTPIVADTCWKVFGDPKTCKANRGGVNEIISTPIDALVGTKMTINQAVFTNAPPFFWQAGDVTREDLRIKIRSWSTGPDLYLAELPPASWIPTGPLTVAVRVRAGCRQILQDCRTFNNEENFGAPGRKIPARNVLFELD